MLHAVKHVSVFFYGRFLAWGSLHISKIYVINYQFLNNLTPDGHSELRKHIFVAHHISGYDTNNWPGICVSQSVLTFLHK
jgi:hypothetical protein